MPTVRQRKLLATLCDLIISLHWKAMGAQASASTPFHSRLCFVTLLKGLERARSLLFPVSGNRRVAQKQKNDWLQNLGHEGLAVDLV